jgi:hypothetical protein
MPDEGFSLPSSSYKELIKIIQGYGRFATDASLGDVARLTAMNETIVSANNKFLVATGVVKGKQKKTITPLGAELAIALQHELPDEISAKWRAIVEANDFLQKMIASVRIRKGMDETSLESHVAYSAGQPKTPAVATGARTIVDILKVAGLLKDEGGNLVATTPEPRPIPETVEKTLSISDAMLPTDSGETYVQGSFARASRIGGVRLNIDVTVQCTPNDLDDLGRKLRKVLQDFNEPEKRTESPTSPPPVPAENGDAEG